MSVQYPYAKATPQHRLGALALDSVLMPLTLYIGYFIWVLITWGSGQTPGKQILKVRVYASQTGRPATWGHMAIRQFLIPITVSLAAWIPIILLGGTSALIPSESGLIAATGVTLLLQIALLSFSVADYFWVFKGTERRRITDLWAKTDVLNECLPTQLPVSAKTSSSTI